MRKMKTLLIVFLAICAVLIAAFVFIGRGNGETRNLSYEALYNKYIAYGIDFPGDSFEAERKFAFKLLEGAKEIKPDFPVGEDTRFYDPAVFEQYLPKGAGNVSAYLNENSLCLSYVSEDASRVSIFYPRNPNAENIPLLSILVPSVESIAIFNRPEFITYSKHSSNKGQIFYPEGKAPPGASRSA